MNTIKTPKLRNIVPFFLLSGLLTIIVSCSSPVPRPETAPEASEPVTLAPAPMVEKKIRVKETYPRQYTVKKDDTLWDISSLFLQDPWYWPEIWQNNAQIENPHLIYPGDVLTLIYVDGQPQMRLNNTRNNNAGHKTVTQRRVINSLPVRKLSPGIRSTSLQANIPSIPGDAIRQFLSKPRVVTQEQLENAPRIIASDENHLVLGSGNRVYVRGEMDKERVRFAVFNPGAPLIDPVSDEVLGYEASYAGQVRIVEYGDPASGDIIFSEREILIGDRLLPEDKGKLENLYFPHVPDKDLVNAQIISLYDALFGVGQYQIVVINRGERDGMEVGHLLAAYTNGETVRDPYDKESNALVKLPNERSGLVMVFKTFDRVSYAITLESKRVIHNYDYVQTPKP